MCPLESILMQATSFKSMLVTLSHPVVKDTGIMEFQRATEKKIRFMMIYFISKYKFVYSKFFCLQ